MMSRNCPSSTSAASTPLSGSQPRRAISTRGWLTTNVTGPNHGASARACRNSGEWLRSSPPPMRSGAMREMRTRSWPRGSIQYSAWIARDCLISRYSSTWMSASASPRWRESCSDKVVRNKAPVWPRKRSIRAVALAASSACSASTAVRVSRWISQSWAKPLTTSTRVTSPTTARA